MKYRIVRLRDNSEGQMPLGDIVKIITKFQLICGELEHLLTEYNIKYPIDYGCVWAYSNHLLVYIGKRMRAAPHQKKHYLKVFKEIQDQIDLD